MKRFVLRLTHIAERLDETRDQIIAKFKCAYNDRTPTNVYVVRLLDKFDNIYYGEVVVFREDFDGYGMVYSTQLKRQFVGPIAKAKACLEEKYLWMQHSPLCPNCWKEAGAHRTTVNAFRLALKKSVKAPCPDADAPYPQNLLDLFSEKDGDILERADDPLKILDGRSMN